MKRAVLSAILLALACVSPAIAGDASCSGCEAAEKAQKRTVKGKGQPDPQAVCFYASMSDPTDSISVTISYGKPGKGAGDAIITFPRKAAQAMSGNPNRPMVCVPRQKLSGATQVLIVPGSGEGCTTLTEQDIRTVLHEKSIGMAHPVCLRSEDTCRQIAAQLPPGHYGRE
jgi:hypothetical protein